MGTLIAKIARASAAVGGALSTDKRNMDSKYDYVSADKILSVAGQALADAGVAVLPSVTSSEVLTFERGQGKNRYDARVDFVFFLADEESQIEMTWIGYGSDYTVPDKAIYKAITSGHKYFLAKLLNIGAGNEDGEHESSAASSSGSDTAAGRVNNGSGPCKVCHAPVGKIHASTCTAQDEAPKSTPPTQPPTATEEFVSIPSPQPGQTSSAHTNGNGNGKVKQAAAVQSAPPATDEAEAGKVSKNGLKAFHATGTDLYGKGWDDKRAEIVKTITQGRTESSGELTPDEASRLIEMMKKRIAERDAQAVPA